ncbi:DUF2149 domain-containing protein [Nitrogeniibacter aestuarii]|uniref:DUF2149 domain-containing protein n=1 Tax=Nitrogeniibacter aestuarii TaxID=2815343 RepID=UPI001D1273ED|nr:DUF2149 domain-containing protein [Nitrogeniibacter aestuarii]
MRNALMDEAHDEDPILSVVNLIDVFLVLIAALLLSVANSPLSPYGADQVTVIRNPGSPDMELVIKDGEKIERFKADGTGGAGGGERAGVAYRMKDGSMVYVPETRPAPRIDLPD